eukprot:scaffold81859_cov29-Prasinocladus_malaysianus.AAC.2
MHQLDIACSALHGAIGTAGQGWDLFDSNPPRCNRENRIVRMENYEHEYDWFPHPASLSAMRRSSAIRNRDDTPSQRLFLSEQRGLDEFGFAYAWAQCPPRLT